MSKQISAKELAEIVTKLLTTHSGEVDGFESFQGFMTDIAEVVCNHCGGEVHKLADRIEETWYVGIHGNDSLPGACGGIWREYDPEGELFDHQREPRCDEAPEPDGCRAGYPDSSAQAPASKSGEITRKITIVLRGDSAEAVEDCFDEAVMLLKNGVCSGKARDETSEFYFTNEEVLDFDAQVDMLKTAGKHVQLPVLPHVAQPEKTVLVKALREFETFGDSAKEHSPDVDDSHGGLAQSGTAPNQAVGNDMSDYISVVTIQQGLAALEDGTSVDLTKIQAALNEAFAETGDRDYMKASDELARLTGLEQTAQGFVMVPSPAGSTIGGFTMGHAARMNRNQWMSPRVHPASVSQFTPRPWPAHGAKTDKE